MTEPVSGETRQIAAHVMFRTGDILDAIATAIEDNDLSGPQAVAILRSSAQDSREFSDTMMRTGKL